MSRKGAFSTNQILGFLIILLLAVLLFFFGGQIAQIIITKVIQSSTGNIKTFSCTLPFTQC